MIARDSRRSTLSRFVGLMILFIAAGGASSKGAQESKTRQATPLTLPQRNTTSTNAPPVTAVRPESSSIADNVYTNDFFGFTYEFPKGWSIEDEQTMKYVAELSKAAISGGDPTKKAVVEEQWKRNHVLLAVHQHPYGTPVPLNPAITVWATDESVAPGIQSGRDYLLALRMSLPQQRLDLKVIREPTDCTFDGKLFSRMDMALEAANEKSSYLSHVAIVLNRFALDYMFTAETPDRLEALVQTLNTLQFHPKAETAGNTRDSLSSNQGLAVDPTSIRIEMLTRTQNVDFQTYLRRLVEDVKRNWDASMPREILNGEKGKTIVRFQIERDGNLGKGGPRVELHSTNGTLDEAALNVIRHSAPFERLPTEFNGRRIEIQFSFFYNDPGQIIPQ